MRNGKDPGFSKWQVFKCLPDQVEIHFTPEKNIGLLLGKPSNGLVDVDLDTDKAVAVASYFLPATGMVAGHDRRPGSHEFYQLIDAEGNPFLGGETKQFKYTLDKKETTVVELRSTGSQTVVAPPVTQTGGLIAGSSSTNRDGCPIPISSTQSGK